MPLIQRDAGGRRGMRPKLTIREKILSLLEAEPQMEYNAKSIAAIIRKDYSSVRKELRRMVDRGLIDNPHWGFYRSKNVILSAKGVAYPEPLIHGLKLEYRGKECHRFRTGSFLDSFKVKYWVHRRNHAYEIFATPKIEGEIRRVTITIHRNKDLVEVWVPTSNKALTPEGLNELSAWLQGKFELPPSAWMLIQAGINYDFPGLKLDGIKSITLEQFENALIRLYDKGDRVRYELHLSHKKDDARAINLGQAVTILKYGIEGKKGDEKGYEELKNLILELNSKVDIIANAATTLLRVENTKLNYGEIENKGVEGYA